MGHYLKERRKNTKGYKAQGNGQMGADQAVTNYRKTKSYLKNNQHSAWQREQYLFSPVIQIFNSDLTEQECNCNFRFLWENAMCL